MAYYAADDWIGTTPREGAIEISKAAWDEALAAVTGDDGRTVQIIDGQMVLAAPPEPEPEPEPEPTPEEQRAALGLAVQAHLDKAARGMGYDGMLAIATYAADPNPLFAAEAAAGIAWRSAVWTKVAEIEADVMAGLRPAPTAAELIAELPAVVWP